MKHTLINADVMDGLKRIPDGSVHCVVTSPPYWGLRDYGIEGQIGLEATPEEHVQKIVEVFREVRRVLRDDGTLWLNYGDLYTSGNRTGHGSKIGWKQETNRGSDGLRDAPRLPLSCGLKPKDLVGMPWRVALALQADGWYLRSDIIWSKPNPMPESVTDRPTKSHEYIFLLAKSQRYFYDAEAIREGVSGGAHSKGEYKGDLPKTAKPGKGIKQNSSFIRGTWDDPEKHPYKGKHSAADPQSAGRRIQLNHKKALEESQKGCIVVGLVRHDPSAKWYQNYVHGKAHEVRMLKRRVHFVNPETGKPEAAYNFPCCVVVWKPGIPEETEYKYLDW